MYVFFSNPVFNPPILLRCQSPGTYLPKTFLVRLVTSAGSQIHPCYLFSVILYISNVLWAVSIRTTLSLTGMGVESLIDHLNHCEHETGEFSQERTIYFLESAAPCEHIYKYPRNPIHSIYILAVDISTQKTSSSAVSYFTLQTCFPSLLWGLPFDGSPRTFLRSRIIHTILQLENVNFQTGHRSRQRAFLRPLIHVIYTHSICSRTQLTSAYVMQKSDECEMV